MSVRIIYFIFLALLACDNAVGPGKFEGVILNNGPLPENTLGLKGKRDLEDWTNEKELHARAAFLLGFDDDLSLDNTTTEEVRLFAYPNPTNALSYFGFSTRGGGSVKMKAILVNEKYVVLDQFAIKGSSATITMNLSDSKKYRNGEIVRIYYAFSSKDKLNFFTGHGDIWICRANCN